MKIPNPSLLASLALLLPATGFSAITTSTANSPLTGSPISVAAGSSANFQITGLGSSAGATDNYRFGGANNASGFLTADYTVSTTGGPLTSVGNNLSGVSRLKGIGLTTGAGVTSFTITTTFDRYLHGLLTNSSAAQNPWLTSVLPGTPAGFEYNVDIEYSDIATLLTNGSDNTIANSTAHLGLSPSNPLVSDHVVTYKTDLASASGAPVTTFAGSGASQTITTSATLNNTANWLGLNSVRPNPPSSPWNFAGSSSDFNGLSDPADLIDADVARIQQVSARTVSFTFTAISGGGAFPTGTEFTTSMDGRQQVAIQEVLAGLAPIPEPSRALLIGLGLSMAVLARRRPAS